MAETVVPPVTAATTSPTATATTSSSSTTIANNFNSFLQLLTTQLKNQNPLDPLDTNQFTQQLVQFASVEQQINMNTQLGTLISLQKTSQTTAALGFVGQKVLVDGNTAQLANGQAKWSYVINKPATATINITNAAGQVVYTQTGTVQAGTQNYTWNGRDAAGNTVPDGAYTIAITAKDTSGQSVAVSTQVQGVVDSVDVTQNPPVLWIGDVGYTLDKIKQVVRSGL